MKKDTLTRLIELLKEPNMGTAYAVGNWWYENCPDYICTTPKIVHEFIRERRDMDFLLNVFNIQKQVKIEGIPTVKEEIHQINKKVYDFTENIKVPRS